jgi:DNA repair exonuclease SbcCD nuclease subunit
MNKALVIGDLHFKDRRGYADYIEDGRVGEEEEVYSALVRLAEDCDTVIMLGDQLNAKNNTTGVVTRFTNFIERFKDKKLYILAGNHEKWANGKCALDYLSEIGNKHWTVITREVKVIDGMVFCPYFSREELGCETPEEATQKLVSSLPKGDFFFTHLGVSGATSRLMQVDLFNEPVIPAEALSKYKKSFFGHIHEPQQVSENIIGTGSVFTDEVGEIDKFAYTVNKFGLVEKHKLPVRPIYNVTDPTPEELNSLKKMSIVKAVFIEKVGKEFDWIKSRLEGFDALIILEQRPTERRKIAFTEGKNILSLGVEELLEIYAKQNKIETGTLLKGWNIIKTYEKSDQKN